MKKANTCPFEASGTLNRPMLRWHGGKWRLANWIHSYFPQHRIYVEPFCGAASVLLRKSRCYAEYLNDLDGELINLFHVLWNDIQAHRLIKQLTLTPFARKEFEAAYGDADDPVERARHLCVRSFMGFASVSGSSACKTGFRCKSFRSTTGPAMDWYNYPECLWAVAERLRGVTIESQPALRVIERLDTPETLFYVDPPYPATVRKSFGAYRYEMNDAEHEQLAACLRACQGYIVLSGYECEMYTRLYGGWVRIERRCKSDHGWRMESLWLSPRTAEKLRAQ